ncbi:MAG: squalene--hopene cyclase [Synechococcales cyanobacterium RM1_1_8]|nr:squalene--hopene cyclase [Synechococcales cyanobacterium RM1_1_8]
MQEKGQAVVKPVADGIADGIAEGISPGALEQAIAHCQTYLLAQQKPDGHWIAELESNVTMAAEVVLLHKAWGSDKTRPLAKVVPYILNKQVASGGWELYYGDGGDLSTSVEAYMGLRLLGMPATDPAMQKAKAFILGKGGISKTRVFTKFHLALIGCYNWRGIPSIPPWVMLLPDSWPIYEMSSWARGSTVPLLIVFDRKPVFALENPITLNELYTEGKPVITPLPSSNDWSDIFLHLDNLFKAAEDLNLVPFRTEGLKAAEKWVLERQEATGDWGGIIPAMLNSMLALKALDYDANDPIVQRGLGAIDNFGLEDAETYRMQACVSPVWDTAWVIRALVESGLAPDHEAITQGAKWLLDKQIFDYGDWQVKNRQGAPGAWAFEYDNRFYPDLDDTAVVVMTLNQVSLGGGPGQNNSLPNDITKLAAMQRAANWCASMQCKAGGWAAFDIDNDQDWLNQIPYGDLKAMIDPNTADVTSRVLEMVGETPVTLDAQRIRRGLDYLLAEQEADGSWFGRWGVNYIYGTSGALSALALVEPEQHRSSLERGAQWLLGCQNADGGWGETCESYKDSSLKGQGDSTASQTAWALIGLLAAGEGMGQFAWAAIEQGVGYLLATQKPDGTWDDAYFTGTGFPCHFYLNYHYYRLYFPLLALGRYRRMQRH